MNANDTPTAQSETPSIEHAVMKLPISIPGVPDQFAYVVEADFARKLYRELSEANSRNAELRRWQIDLWQDQCEGALVSVTFLDEARRVITELNPAHPFLTHPIPSYSVWSDQRVQIDRLQRELSEEIRHREDVEEQCNDAIVRAGNAEAELSEAKRALAAAQTWIAVDVCLPEDGHFIFFAVRGRVVRGYFQANEFVSAIGLKWGPELVTHWMPSTTPTPPAK